jgi:Amt family ammonium transporter
LGISLTAILAQSRLRAAFYDSLTIIPGGWLDCHWIQLAWHIADSVAGLSYSESFA